MPSDLVNHLWQSTVFAVVAALLSFAFRRNRAQVRYWLWFSASFKFLVPFSLLVSLGRHFARAAFAHNVAAHIAAPALGFAMTPVSASLPDLLTLAPTESSGDWRLIALAALWACGFAGIALMRLHGYRGVRVAVRSSAPVELPGLQTKVDVRSSPGLLEPGVVGVFRSVLLLPADLEKHLTPAQLRAVLAHELCHVRRRDNLFASIHMFVEAIFWFHPLVWWIGARMVEERERACDEEVLSLVGEPRSYAEGILNVCRLYVESPLSCVAGITGANLKRRIESIMTNRIGRRLNLANKVLLASAGVVALAVPLVIGMGNDAFEVATIKPANPDIPGRYFRTSGTGFAAHNRSLADMICWAYGIQVRQIIGAPAWVESEKYDLQAKFPSEGMPSEAQVKTMLQKLVADRFQFAFHNDKKELSGYAIVVAKDGPKLTKSTGDPDAGGSLVFQGFGRLPGRNVTIADLAGVIQNNVLDQPVIDKTGLPGRWDFSLNWTPDEFELAKLGEPPLPPENATAPSLFTAFQQQLGLKLQATKGLAKVLVIDRVEKPSEN